MPASRNARAMIFAPRSWPSRPGLATTTRILRAVCFSSATADIGFRSLGDLLLHLAAWRPVVAARPAVAGVAVAAPEQPVVAGAADQPVAPGVPVEAVVPGA